MPFSGSVSWNAIPGGFQPLPQTVGGRKKLYQLSQFHGGLNQKSSPRDISDNECTEGTNISFGYTGRIKLLGDMHNMDNQLDSALSASITASSGKGATAPGFGLFQFAAVSDQDATAGAEVITLVGDGSQVDAHSVGGNSDAGWMDMPYVSGGEDTIVAHIFYAAGSGVYVADARGAHSRRAKVYIYRKDYDSATPANASSLIVNKWAEGAPLINSPKFDTTATDGSVNLEWDDGTVSFTDTTVAGSATIHIGSSGKGMWGVEGFSNTTCATANTDATVTMDDTSFVKKGMIVTGTGVPDDTTVLSITNATTFELSANATATNDPITLKFNIPYHFYISWLFDNGCETGMTSLITTGGTVPRFVNQNLEFNLSVEDDHSSRNYLGGDERIEGARIYFKELGSEERYLLAEGSVVDGVKVGLDSTFTPWKESGSAANTFKLEKNAIIKTPPYVRTFFDLNQYFAEEVYSESHDTLADGNDGPAPHSVTYRTATVGPNGAIYIGDVNFNGKEMQDSMMWSIPPGNGTPSKPAVFPKFNIFDSPSSDGSRIVAIHSFRDKILQFKQNALYVINIAKPAQPFTENSFRNCGVMNQCQTFPTPFGIAFVNSNGVFVYDGAKVTALTGGKFDIDDLGIEESSFFEWGDAAKVPCIGYDPRSQRIIVLKDIGDNSTKTGAWVYDMYTKSFSEADEFIVNGNEDRHTNFIITSRGYLTITRPSTGNVKNYNHNKSNFTDATCDYNNDETISHDDDNGKIAKGMTVYGTGIPAGAYVASVTSDTAFELSAPTTGGSVTNGSLTFGGQNITF